MTSSSIVWFSVDRGNVAKALLGSQDASPRAREAANRLPEPLAGGEVAVGFTSGATDLLMPALAVVDKHHAEDLFAWLATYSPEVFPLSQYVRLLDSEEWAHVGQVPASTRIDADPIWPSLILGELLAQGSSSELRLTSVPLSRVPFCRSYTQARASALFQKNPAALRIAADRLELLDKAENHARNMSTGELRATWALAEDAFALDPFIQNLTRLLSWTFDRQRESRGLIPGLPQELQEVSVDLRKLASGPLEYRVEEFDRVASQLLSGGAAGSDVSKARLPALFAALALWVGSGTSHISLLAEVSKKLPATFAWFGAFAGVLGPISWHSDWTRTNAAISKLLRGGFDIASTSTADLSWSEFAWLRSVGQFEMLASMPRASARVLSVDVLPGAPAPFRLSGEDNQGSIHMESPKTDRAATKQAVAPPSSNGVAAVAKATTAVDDVKLSNQQMTELLAAAEALSKLLESVKHSVAPISEERFELKPAPVGAKRATSTARKPSRKPGSKKGLA
ncbi:hypothetical protein [Cupriavidus sp. RAF12]|uniref:hypothetical protein n=1 Tax=Cupriavidus sp. RAF12 TaxID=3233050 RepID=UPI003F916C02